jgi:hypothetical protein
MLARTPPASKRVRHQTNESERTRGGEYEVVTEGPRCLGAFGARTERADQSAPALATPAHQNGDSVERAGSASAAREGDGQDGAGGYEGGVSEEMGGCAGARRVRQGVAATSVAAGSFEALPSCVTADGAQDMWMRCEDMLRQCKESSASAVAAAAKAHRAADECRRCVRGYGHAHVVGREWV